MEGGAGAYRLASRASMAKIPGPYVVLAPNIPEGAGEVGDGTWQAMAAGHCSWPVVSAPDG